MPLILCHINLSLPPRTKPSGIFMEENQIVNSNAEGQEQADPAIAGEAATATSNVPVQEPVAETVAAHDDFDWSIDKRNVASYSKDEKEKYDKVYENTFVQLNDGEMIRGLVVGITKTDVVLNIGFKSDGLVSLNEFRDISDVKIGDEVEVMVVEKEDRSGHLHLSRKLARQARAWQKIV